MEKDIKDYNNSLIPKVALSEVTHLFKGKAVSKTDSEGNIALINLSDMNETGIDYSNLKTISENPNSLSRYILESGDVLVASKGTVKKVALFELQDRPVIASANITILRPNSAILGSYLHLFLSSEIGQALLEKANTGKHVMNLSTKSILSIEVPKIPLIKQAYLAKQYEQGLQEYKQRLIRAEQEWSRVQNRVMKDLF